MCFLISFKKIYTRFVVGSIESTALLTVISVFNALLEFFMRYTMPIRDRALYKMIFRDYLPMDKNPTALMADARNRGLRAETENLEALTDLVYILSMWMLPVAYKLGICDDTTCKLVDIWVLGSNQLIQYVIEN